jgi:hypothetical protein
MHGLFDIEARNGNEVALCPDTGQALADDRSLAAVLSDIARTFGGWILFVVVVLLLLRGAHLT